MNTFPGEHPAPPGVPVRPPNRRAFVPKVVLVAAAVVAVVAVLVARNGGSDGGAPSGGLPDQSAEAAIQRLTDLSTSGQAGRLYDVLHPAQQGLIDRDDFIVCFGEELDRFPQMRQIEADVTDIYPERILIPGTDEHAEVTAVVVEMRVQGQQVSDTMYLARVNGNWRWINTRLSAEEVASCEPG